MSQTAIPGFIIWPHPSSAINQALTVSVYAIDAADERAACIFQAPKAGDIDVLKFRTSTVTTGATVTVGLYSLDGNGNPDIATGALGTTTLAVADTDDNKWLSVTLGTPVTVTKGQILAMVVSQPSSSAGNIQITTTHNSRDGSWASEFPYGALYTASWAKSGLQRPFFTIDYASSGGRYPCWGRTPFIPGDNTTAITYATISTDSTTKEAGNIFQLPVAATITGAWFYTPIAAGADFYLKLYATPTGTPSEVLTTPLIDGDYTSNTGGGIHLFEFTNTYQCAANTKYAFTFLPNTTTDTFFTKMVANANADYTNLEGGANMYACYRNTTGSTTFTEITTDRHIGGLIFSTLDDGKGGGRASFSIGI